MIGDGFGDDWTDADPSEIGNFETLEGAGSGGTVRARLSLHAGSFGRRAQQIIQEGLIRPQPRGGTLQADGRR